MDTIEITVRVNKVNAGKVKEVGTAHNGTLEDDKTAHALAETEEPAVPLAEKIIDHEILCFTFETEGNAAAFVDAASESHRRCSRHLQGNDDSAAQWREVRLARPRQGSDRHQAEVIRRLA
jgi:hypothetical protein